MTETIASIAIFPGAFDPMTYGHLDIIRRGARLYEKLIIAVGHNPLKEQVFTPQERAEMLMEHTTDTPNVKVQTYTGLTVDFARHAGARVILRGP